MASPHDPLVSFSTSNSIIDTIPTQDQVIQSTSEPISTAPILDSIPSHSSSLPILETQGLFGLE